MLFCAFRSKLCRNGEFYATLLEGMEGNFSSEKGSDMKMQNAIVVGLVTGTMLATPVMAASGETCLRHDRIWSTRVVDKHTIEVTDREYKKYTVHLRGACTGLTWGDAVIIFRTWQNLACISDNDIIGVVTPAFKFSDCYIADVQAGAPVAGGAG
jgi:hypothetical protein